MFAGLKRGQGMTLTTRPDLVLRSRISRSYNSSPLKCPCGVTALVFSYPYSSEMLVSIQTSILKMDAICSSKMVTGYKTTRVTAHRTSTDIFIDMRSSNLRNSIPLTHIPITQTVKEIKYNTWRMFIKNH
jgi:hypothetical protein